MFTLVLGETGSGKTSFSYANACNEMFNRERLRGCNKITNELNAGGFNLTAPEDHVVFTETWCESHNFGKKPRTSYLCNGKRFGLPNDNIATDFYPPYSFIVVDESQKDFDSRNFQKLMDYIKRGWETNRHMEYDAFFVSQFANVDKNLRSVANRVVLLKEKFQRYSKEKYSHIQSFWSYLEFEGFEEYEKWVGAGKPKIKTLEYVYDGDIKRCYDDHAYRALWLKGRENSQYTLIRNKKMINTIDSINDFVKTMEGQNGI